MRGLGHLVARLVRGLFVPPGDLALRGLEHDLARVASLDQGWERLGHTAWALGFVELRLAPEPWAGDLLAERQALAPRPWPTLDRRRQAHSTWSFSLTVAGRPAATVTARRRLSRVDFEPQRLVAALQGLVDRFVAAPAGAPAGGRVVASVPAVVAEAGPSLL